MVGRVYRLSSERYFTIEPPFHVIVVDLDDAAEWRDARVLLIGCDDDRFCLNKAGTVFEVPRELLEPL